MARRGSAPAWPHTKEIFIYQLNGCTNSFQQYQTSLKPVFRFATTIQTCYCVAVRSDLVARLIKVYYSSKQNVWLRIV